ncbi:MAG: hypothetical protein PWP23_965 [Candidatus Sumerlaeota bacterium]|nr:hypothetical protein [Candidatus Sumerlaeota bacterium]
MLKKLLPVALVGMAATAIAGDRLGIAQSTGDFRLTRGETVQMHRAGFLAAVEKGDVLAAGKTALRVEQPAAGAYIVGPESVATTLEAGLVQLRSGTLVVASEPDTPLHATSAGLVVEPVVAAQDPVRTVYLLRTAEEGVTEVEVVSGSVIVREAKDEKQVGYLSEGDALRFERSEGNWQAGSIGIGQDATTAETGGVTGEQGDNKRRAIILLRGPGGGGVGTGAAGGGLGAGAAITTIGVGAVTAGVVGGDDSSNDERGTRHSETVIGSHDDDYFEEIY